MKLYVLPPSPRAFKVIALKNLGNLAFFRYRTLSDTIFLLRQRNFR
jgi:hypothetical protein